VAAARQDQWTGIGLRNSLAVALTTAVLATLLGLLAAGGLQRMRRRLRGGLLALLLLPRIVPPIVLSGPIFLWTRQVRMHDTLTALAAIHTGLALPLAVVVLDGALREVPGDLLDAARLDGASELRVLVRIAAPLLGPVLVAIGTLSFALSWVEYLFAQTNHASRAYTLTLSVAFLEERDGVQFEHVGSHLVLVLLPPLVLGLLAQRVVARGFSLGAVRSDR
jgi:multiple sugar transport system permease protein